MDEAAAEPTVSYPGGGTPAPPGREPRRRRADGRVDGIDANGVFKGGGAKGIAYVGALEVCERQGVRFRAVAGSSAGAITAALVAAGYRSEDLARLLPDVLAQMDSPRRSFFALHRRSLLRGAPLESWLDRTLAAKIATADRVTFRELHDATGASLYVVAMDAERRQPVVFSPDLTPDMGVGAAVTASAAIPVAFPAHRVSTDAGVTRLIDGGVWANYPHFVFLDPEFRSVHDLRDGAEQRPTIGFTLEERDTGSPHPGRIRSAVDQRPLDTDGGSAARRLGVAGALLSSNWVKGLAVAVPFLAGLSLLFAAWWAAGDNWRRVGSAPEMLQPAIIVLLILFLAVAVLVIAVTILISARLARSALDEGLSGLSAAMGVGPSVPYWLGGAGAVPGRDRHALIRIRVPDSVGTLSFRPKAAAVEEALAAGRRAATGAFAGRVAGAARSPVAAAGSTGSAAPEAARSAQDPKGFAEALGASLFLGLLKAVAFGLIAVVAVRQASDRRITVVIPLVVIGIGVAWSVRTYAVRRHRRATGRRTSLRSLGIGWNLLIAVMMGLFAGVGFGLSQFGSTVTELSTVGGRTLRAEVYDEDVPVLRLLQADSVDGIVTENEIVGDQRLVTVEYSAWDADGCASPTGTIRYPVGRILGVQYGVDETFSVPFEASTCTILWTERGGKPEVGDGLYLALVGIVSAIVSLNAFAAAGFNIWAKLRARRRQV